MASSNNKTRWNNDAQALRLYSEKCGPTVKDPGKGPQLVVNAKLLNDVAVLRAVASARLQRYAVNFGKFSGFGPCQLLEALCNFIRCEDYEVSIRLFRCMLLFIVCRVFCATGWLPLRQRCGWNRIHYAHSGSTFAGQFNYCDQTKLTPEMETTEPQSVCSVRTFAGSPWTPQLDPEGREPSPSRDACDGSVKEDAGTKQGGDVI